MQNHKISPALHLLTGILCLLLSMTLVATQVAHAQTTGTGSRVGGAAFPKQIVNLNPSTEIKNIRKLLSQGDTEEAYRRAQSYLDYVEFSNLDAITRYHAHNALCAVETHRGEFEAALDACDEAIDIFPGIWSALNNRGTAKLLSGDYQGALEDYQLALEGASEFQGDTVEIIRHNIALTESRMP